MAKKNDKQKNSFYVRIYDDELLQSIYELDNTKQYSSMNDLMTQALAIGVNEIYKTFGKKFDFDTLEQAKSFIDERIAKVEYVEINQEFEAYFYQIFQYNEDTEEYDIDCDVDFCEYWEQEYKPCYSSEQVKDELYYYIDNIDTKQLVELNNFIFAHQTEHTSHNCVDELLIYDEDKEDDFYFCIDYFVDFIFWNDELPYDNNIKQILSYRNV